jgi:quercetin dioxygenase-like cupin family protein
MQVVQGRVVQPKEAQFSSPFSNYKLLGAQTSGVILSHIGSLSPGTLIGPHTHSREDEITYVVEGELTIELGEEILSAPAGSVVWRPRGQRHAIWNSTGEPAHFFEVVTPAESFEAFTHDVTRLVATGKIRDQLLDVGHAHGIEFDLRHTSELIGRFNLRPLGG